HGFLPAAVRAGAGAHLGWRAYQPAPQPWHEDVAGDARAVSPRDGGRRRDPRRTGVVSRSAVRVAQGLDRPDTGPHDVRVERPRPRPRPRWRRTDRPLRVRRLPLCRTARCQPLDPRGAPHGAGRGDHRPRSGLSVRTAGARHPVGSPAGAEAVPMAVAPTWAAGQRVTVRAVRAGRWRPNRRDSWTSASTSGLVPVARSARWLGYAGRSGSGSDPRSCTRSGPW